MLVNRSKRGMHFELVRGESRGYMETRGGWRLDTRHQKKTTLKNFPIQAEATEIMHLGTIKMADSGVQIATTVHDAVLALDRSDTIERTAQLITECWTEAGQEVIGYPIVTHTSFVADLLITMACRDGSA